MKNLFGEKSDPEVQAREAMHRRKWSKALDYYTQKLQENERNLALWNLVGDLHLNNRARAQAVEAWRRALEGYALEGLHENVLGIARKILRLTPEEEDVHLLLAEAYLGLEYHADCLASLRSYLKLCHHRSESDMRSLFKKILDQQIQHIHLLEEMDALYKESGIEDIELEHRLRDFVEAGRQAAAQFTKSDPEATADWQYPESGAIGESAPAGEDLITLDGLESFADDPGMQAIEYTPAPDRNSAPTRPDSPSFESEEIEDPMGLPAGEGKDHYDLGMVYKEMTLWDAAIAEFEHARRDRSVRARATLALAECMQESRDLQGALELLEEETRNGENPPAERLPLMHQLGIVHELLGNLAEALGVFEIVREHRPGFGDVETRIIAIQSRLGNGND